VRIYNKKSFVMSIIWLLVSLWGVAALMIKGLDMKLIILVPIQFALGCMTLSFSMSNKNAKIERNAADERDRLIMLKCGHVAMKRFFLVCFLVFVIFMIIYAISTVPSLLVVLITLGATMLFLCILLLVLNIYFESHC